jgi:ATP-dependent DNA helicase DinG
MKRFVVIDVETTGNLPKKTDRIIQIGMILIENGQIVDEFSTYLTPDRNIPSFITQLTGIDAKTVQGAPRFEDVAPQILTMLEGATLVAHNASFDVSFLDAELENAGYNSYQGLILDTVEMARILYPTLDGYRLTDLATYFHIEHDRPHQADSDTFVTAMIFIEMLKKMKKLPLHTLELLIKLAPHLKSHLSFLLQEITEESRSKMPPLSSEYEYYRGLVFRKRVRTDKQLKEKIQVDISYPQKKEEKINSPLLPITFLYQLRFFPSWLTFSYFRL